MGEEREVAELELILIKQRFLQDIRNLVAEIDKLKERLERRFDLSRIAVGVQRAAVKVGTLTGKALALPVRAVQKLNLGFQKLRENMRASIPFISTWWRRFGEVAFGFTLAYRAMVALENGLRAVVGFLRDAVDLSGELVSTQARLAMWGVLFGGIKGFDRAFRAARGSVIAFAQASIDALSSTRELMEGIDELAQHGVPTTMKTARAVVNLVDFITMIAASSTAVVRQVRQEIQSYFEGVRRPGATLLRTVRNLTHASSEQVKALEEAHTAWEKLAALQQLIGPLMERVRKVVVSQDWRKAAEIWKRTWLYEMEKAVRLAGQLAGARGNVFAAVFAQHWRRIDLTAITDQTKRLAYVYYYAARAIDFALNAFDRFVDAISYGATAFHRFLEFLRETPEQLKTTFSWMLRLQVAAIAAKAIFRLAAAFRTLAKQLIIMQTRAAAIVAPLLALVSAVYISVTGQWEDTLLAVRQGITRLLEWIKEKWASFLSGFPDEYRERGLIGVLLYGWKKVKGLSEWLNVQNEIRRFRDWLSLHPELAADLQKAVDEWIKKRAAAAGPSGYPAYLAEGLRKFLFPPELSEVTISGAGKGGWPALKARLEADINRIKAWAKKKFGGLFDLSELNLRFDELMGDLEWQFRGTSEAAERFATEIKDKLARLTHTELGYQIIKLREWAEEAQKALGNTSDKVAQVNEVVSKQTAELVQNFVEQINQLSVPEVQRRLTSTLEKYEQMRRTLQDLKDLGVALNYEELTGKINRAASAAVFWASRMGQYISQTINNLQNSLSMFLTDAFTGQLKSAEDYFRSFCNAIVKAWADMIARMAAEWMRNKVLSWVTGGGGAGGWMGLLSSVFSLGGLFGGGGGGTAALGSISSSTAASTSLGPIPSTMLEDMAKLGVSMGQEGLIASEPTLAVIGEAWKPEAVVPLEKLRRPAEIHLNLVLDKKSLGPRRDDITMFITDEILKRGKLYKVLRSAL